MTVKTLVSALVATAAAIGAIGTITGTAKAYLDRHYVATPVFALYVHDDSLRHTYAERQRAIVRATIDSIERAHQHQTGRVILAGDPR
jgi:hypothetical protein